MHEQLISKDEAQYTYEYDNFFKILSPLNNWNQGKKRIGKGQRFQKTFFILVTIMING